MSWRFTAAGARSARLWPVLLVAGGSFAASQFVASNYLDYALTDVLSALGSLVGTLAFLQVWSPKPRSGIRHQQGSVGRARRRNRCPALAGLAALADRLGRRHRLDPSGGSPRSPSRRSPGRACDKAISITLYNGKALCRRLDLPAARHRHGDPAGGGRSRRWSSGFRSKDFLGAIRQTAIQILHRRSSP